MNKYRKKAWFFAIVFHLFILCILVFSLRMPSVPIMATVVSPTTEIVNAVQVDQTKVQQEMNRLKAEAEAKQKAEQTKQKKLAEKAAEAKKARLQEEKQLAALKVQQKQLQKQKEAAETEAKKHIEALKSEAKQLELQAQVKKEQDLRHQEELKLQKQIEAEEARVGATQKSEWSTEIDRYKGLILNAIGEHWIIPQGADKTLTTILLIRLAPDGTVLGVRIVKPSGNDVLDRSAITAVWKASPLPVPKDPQIFNEFRELRLTVRPEEAMARG